MSSSPNAIVIAEGLRRVIGRLKRRFREQADAGALNWSQLSMLSRLERDGPSTVTTLARAQGVRPQSMGAMIREMETAGHVTGTPDPADGRQTLWSVTAACRELVQTARAARQDWLINAVQKNFSPEEQDIVAHAVTLLERIAEH